jgi:pimeloyl-ACP methyl ester carboxylesterase
MWLLAHRLKKSGFKVHNVDYPSTKLGISELVDELATHVNACCDEGQKPLHFVTHSLGGILVRAYLAEHRPQNLGRVVMLSPPNQGTELVDRVVSHPLIRWATGPTAQELGTAPSSLPNRLGPADFELGVITGSRSLNPVASWLIAGADDGVVSVSSARLKGMADFLVVPKSHTFIMNSSEVAREVIYFLNHGAFSLAAVARWKATEDSPTPSVP